MSETAPHQLILTGLDEALQYHDPGEHGFFALLLADPERAEWASKIHTERQQLTLRLEAAKGQAEANRQVAALEAALEKLPRRAPKIQRSYRLSQMPRIIERLDPTLDTWISQAEFFRPNRRLVYLLRLSLCFVDLDTYKTDWGCLPPESLAFLVFSACADEGVPPPSVILFSGRGLQVKWFFAHPLPRAVLPRWNAVQSQLVQLLARFGADQQAKDASRVLRLVDTVNTRTGERVRVLWANECNGQVVHYDFEYLAECILPVARQVIRDRAKERRQDLAVIPGGKKGNLRTFSGRQLAWDRLEDLRTLAQLRGWTESGIPHGYRSKYIHWCLNFLLLSGAVHSSQLFYEAQALVREICPDFARDKDVRSVLSTLYRKAQAYEAGEKIEFQGRKYPPLYTPQNSTLMSLFSITDAEMRQLKTIVTKEEARHRDAERHRHERRETGVLDRATYLQTVKETAEQRRAQARLLRARGLSWEKVGEEMGISSEAARKLASR